MNDFPLFLKFIIQYQTISLKVFKGKTFGFMIPYFDAYKN